MAGLYIYVSETNKYSKERLKDLKRIVEEHHSQGGGVLLMIYANDDWEKELKGDFTEFLLETQLEDVHKMRQQEKPKTTHSRGYK